MAYNRIDLHGSGEELEGVAAAAVTPGHLVERIAAGTYQKHATANGAAELIFAREDALQGNSVDDAYAAADRMMLTKAKNGNEIYAWLKDGQTVVIGDKLVSNGDGTLKKYVAPTLAADHFHILATAQEAVDLAAAGADGRIVVRVL